MPCFEFYIEYSLPDFQQLICLPIIRNDKNGFRRNKR